MGNTMAKVDGSQIGAGIVAGKVEEADPLGARVDTGKMEAETVETEISVLQEKPLRVTAEQLKALQDASLELGLVKLQEASDFFTASARFAAARQISYLREPDQGMHYRMHYMMPRLIALGVFWGTPAQRAALERATKKHLQIDARHVDDRALEVYKKLRKTHVPGDKLLSPLEVARVLKAEASVLKAEAEASVLKAEASVLKAEAEASVLKAEASVSWLHPKDLKNLMRVKMLLENIGNIAGVWTGTGISLGAISSMLQHWNTSFPMSDLPEDFFW